jgi:hypothetical protein
MSPADGKDVVVRRAKALLALTLAVLWLPVTMHCALESVPGLDFLICCGHEGATPHEDDDCGADACATVEAGFYKLQDHDDLITDFTGIDLWDGQITANHSVASLSHPARDVVGWQFASRTALLPRAPTILL